MPFSAYAVAITPFIHNLRTLQNLLKKGQDFAAQTDGKLNDELILQLRLISDMHPLSFQIQRVVAFATGVASTLNVAPAFSVTGKENTFPELYALIEGAIKVLDDVKPEVFDSTEALTDIKWNARTFKTTEHFLVKFAVPSFYFHFVTAYALLRKEGVPVGKGDYLNL